MTFNPNEHLMKIGYGDKAQDYLQVMWRIVWFRDHFPQGTIDTEEIVVDLDREVEAEDYVWNPEKKRKEKVIKRAQGYARYKAIVTDGKGGRSTGHKSENAASFPDFIEKAETGAIGRALAGLGYGTQFTGDDLNEGSRIVDSPVERLQGNSESSKDTTSHPTHNRNTGTTTPSQTSNKTQTNLSDIPTVSKLRETAASLKLKWDDVLKNVFEKPISEGKFTLAALQAKGDDLAPGYCQRIAAYLQSRAA